MFEELQFGVQKMMFDLCKGRKKCVALLTVSKEEDIRQDLPAEELPEQQRFSLQTAWLVVKRVARGHIVKLTCSGREKIWVHYSPEVPWEIRRTTNNNLDHEIFKGWTLDPTNFTFQFIEIIICQFAISQSPAQA